MSIRYGAPSDIAKGVYLRLRCLCSWTQQTLSATFATVPLPEIDLEADNKERKVAWKYAGYPALSRWLASSTDGFAVRRFADANVRVLLKLQNDIVEQERELKAMDDLARELPDGTSHSLRLEAGLPRDRKVDRLDERLWAYLRIHERPLASTEQARGLQKWLEDRPNAIEEDEQKFAYQEEDLLAIRPPRRRRFNNFAQRLHPVSAAFLAGSDNAMLALCGSKRARWLQKVSSMILSLVPLGMLLGPTWAMAFACDCAQRLTIVTGFTILFCLYLVMRTALSTPHRSIAIAGYFALMILILGLTPVWAGSGATYAVKAAIPAAGGIGGNAV